MLQLISYITRDLYGRNHYEYYVTDKVRVVVSCDELHSGTVRSLCVSQRSDTHSLW